MRKDGGKRPKKTGGFRAIGLEFLDMLIAGEQFGQLKESLKLPVVP